MTRSTIATTADPEVGGKKAKQSKKRSNNNKKTNKKRSALIWLQAGIFVFLLAFILLFFLAQVRAPWIASFLPSLSSSSSSEDYDDAEQEEPVCTETCCKDNFPAAIMCTNSGDAATASSSSSTTCTPDDCRQRVFRSQGRGGLGVLGLDYVQGTCKVPNRYGVCDELQTFTGLTNDELYDRLRRRGAFHFEGEHQFWDPKTATALAWYYTTSVDYLFANALHEAKEGQIGELEKGIHEPVLDYSGGVGNNILALAKRGLRSHYFGIGQMEKSFAEYRFRKRGYLDNGMVKVITPWSGSSDWRFNATNLEVLPRDGSLGAIMAIDVLEHIPKYHIVVKAMVDSLKVGGIIMEQSPFAGGNVQGEDVRIHVGTGGISMEQAMGPRMKLKKSGRWGAHWEKISN